MLRFLAFYYDADRYQSPLVSFLNGFMGAYKNLEKERAEEMRKVFNETIHVVYEAIGASAFRPVRALNAAVFDSVMVGLARRLNHGPVTDLDKFKTAYETLLQDAKFLDACGRGTAGEERVKTRISLSQEVFSGLP